MLTACVRIYKMLKCVVYKFPQLTMTIRTYRLGVYGFANPIIITQRFRHLCRTNIGTIRIVIHIETELERFLCPSGYFTPWVL